MSGILSDQQPVRTDEFEGRRFHVREGAEQEYWQCDRCSRNYATIVAAARCANPNHSQILGPRIPKQYKGDLAARANGGVRAGDNGEAAPVRRKPEPGHGGARPVVDPETDGRVKHRTEEERAEARRKTHAESYQRRRMKATDSPSPDMEHTTMPANQDAKVTSWTPERRAAHSARMKQHHAERGNRTTSAAMAPASSTHVPKSPNADQKPQKSMAPPRTEMAASSSEPSVHPVVTKEVAAVRTMDTVIATPQHLDVTLEDGSVRRITDPALCIGIEALRARAIEIHRTIDSIGRMFGTEVPA